MEIKYKSGDFNSFTATRSFALGAFDITVAKDSEVEFDGSTVKYAGAEYNFPQLRSAVTAEWIVPSEVYEEDNPDYGRPVSANIKVRPATSDDGEAKPIEPVTTDSDEQVVMSTAEHASSTQKKNKAARSKMGGKSKVGTEVVEPQDGVPVRALKTAAKSKSQLTAESAGSALREAENVQIDPGEGISEEEALERMTPEDREAYLEKKRSLRSQYITSDKDQPTKVATVKGKKKQEKEGMKLTQEVGGGTAVADPTSGDGKAKEAVREEDGITFKTTNVSEKTKRAQPHPRAAEKKAVMLEDGTGDARIQIARSMCDDFPESYDFSATPKKKLARLQADFDDRPDVIRAVFVAESDEFKAKLMAEFPEVFQS